MIGRAFSRLKKIMWIALPAGILYSIFHIAYPTFLPKLWYMLKDPFSSTAAEERIERKFGIDYEGTSDEKEQTSLELQLGKIKEENPELLKHCSKIVVHGRSTLESPFIKPFMYFSGRAVIFDAVWPFFNSIELSSLNLGTVAHELAHVKHFNTSSEFDRKLDRIVNPKEYGRDLKPNWHFFINKPVEWSDGSSEPRKGFVRPYGANNRYENVATYAEKAFDDSFWETDALQKSGKYSKMLALMNEYEFISKKQFEEIEARLKINDPVWVDAELDRVLKRLQKPKFIRKVSEGPHASIETIYEDSKLDVQYSSGVGFTGITLILKSASPAVKLFHFGWNDKRELQPWCIELDRNPYAKSYEKIKAKLCEQGYEALGNYGEYASAMHPEWN